MADETLTLGRPLPPLMSLNGYSDATQNELLGNYLFLSNPYKAGLPPKNTWITPGGPPPTVVIVTNSNNEHDSPYRLHLPATQVQDYSGTWKFKQVDQYVQRAVRIPYMFYKFSDVDPRVGLLVVDYLLIGFEGYGSN